MRWGQGRACLFGGFLLGVLAVAGALAAVADSAVPRLVRLAGSTPAIRGVPIGSVPTGTAMHVTVVLKPRDPTGLERLAEQVSEPGSSLYRAYLTPARFARRFGASSSELQAVSASLRARGLRLGAVPADRLSIPVSGTAGAIERAFSTRLERVALAGGRKATIASAAPAVPAELAPSVQAVIGLNSLAAPHPLLLRPALRHRLSPREHPHVQTGGPQPCSAASSAASQNSAYTADQIASAYGFSGLYAAGDLGQGVTVAVYELEPNDPSDIASYQACYGTHASVSYIGVDGGAGSGEGSGEAALDIENVIGLAPQANLLVYQAPNANQSVPGSGPYDLFSRIINDDRASVIEVSWGECEQLEGTSGASAEANLFEQAAVQGQSVVSASGDSGSEDCEGSSDVPQPQLAVDDPSSQPFVTGVGGTSMTSIGPPPAESVWNDGGNAVALAGANLGAGGGGISSFWSMPGYQADASGGLGVVNARSSGSPCGASSGDCREVPDVSADADPNHGYVVYYNGSGSDPTTPSGWQAVGGTSAASPVWAALLALVDASSSCHRLPIGFANPALYKAASSSYSSAFNDVTSGNNDYTGTNGGLYPATSGYDMATGLGTPIGSSLGSALCQDSVRLLSPGPQVATVRQPVDLKLTTTGPLGASPAYVSTGLPPGLVLSRSTGRITGKPIRTGTYSVSVGVLDSTLAVASAGFVWTVEGAPRLSGVSLSGLPARRPRLRLTVTAGQGAPGIRSVTVLLPKGLSFRRAKLGVVGPSGARIGYTAHLAGGQLKVTLAKSVRTFTLRIGYPSIALRFRGRVRGPLRVKVSVTDSRRHVSSLTARPR